MYTCIQRPRRYVNHLIWACGASVRVLLGIRASLACTKDSSLHIIPGAASLLQNVPGAAISRFALVMELADCFHKEPALEIIVLIGLEVIRGVV